MISQVSRLRRSWHPRRGAERARPTRTPPATTGRRSPRRVCAAGSGRFRRPGRRPPGAAASGSHLPPRSRPAPGSAGAGGSGSPRGAAGGPGNGPPRRPGRGSHGPGRRRTGVGSRNPGHPAPGPVPGSPTATGPGDRARAGPPDRNGVDVATHLLKVFLRRGRPASRPIGVRCLALPGIAHGCVARRAPPGRLAQVGRRRRIRANLLNSRCVAKKYTLSGPR